ncbi:MAG TPA: hypothetical protein VMT18_14610, partial [Planctomycetota bacterium]|nr:hypothetical protein [Planctomycetota bacterium]
MNISIPDDLKARMDALGESVNWSRIAAQAFERRLEQDRGDMVRELAEDVQAAAAKPGAEALAALLEIIGDAKPELVEAVEEDLGPVFERSLDREHLRARVLDPEWTSEISWPLTPDGLVKVIREFVFGYHERVVEPL